MGMRFLLAGGAGEVGRAVSRFLPAGCARSRAMAEGGSDLCRRFLVGGPPPVAGLRLFAAVTFGMGVISYLAMEVGAPVLVASLGASACLVFFVPAGPFSQPRNVIFGHMLAALTGVAVGAVLGCTWYAAALGVGGAVVVMAYTGTMHPPAAATALIAVITGQGMIFPFVPVAAGAALLTLTAVIVNRLLPGLGAWLDAARKKVAAR